jgi:hypothetical protein
MGIRVAKVLNVMQSTVTVNRFLMKLIVCSFLLITRQEISQLPHFLFDLSVSGTYGAGLMEGAGLAY